MTNEEIVNAVMWADPQMAEALAVQFETFGLGVAVNAMRPEKKKAVEAFLIRLLRQHAQEKGHE